MAPGKVDPLLAVGETSVKTHLTLNALEHFSFYDRLKSTPINILPF